MKYHLIISLLLFALSLFAQQKGASPINNQQSTTSNQNTYAVVVGISDYQDEGIPDLRFADRDAEAFAAFLQSPAGGNLDEDHLKVLLNEQATQAQFAGALDWLWEVVGENDRAIIYFSGHGDVEKKTFTQPGFLLCWDAPARVYMAGGAFPLYMLQEVISTISVQNKAKVIMIADACRSGKLSGSSEGGAQITGSNLAKQYANEIKILSCQPDEYSIEGEQWGGGRGAFSYHLLDGLYGLADGNADNSVNLLEIGRYLEDKVTLEVAPQSQIPMTIGNRGEKLTDVFPDILAELKEGRKGELVMFNSTDSRGIEDDVLAAADSNIVEMYAAFKRALLDKRFLSPSDACADVYYSSLIVEPSLEQLHSSMRRNYAAALQDEAQQVLNIMLKSGLTDQVLKAANVNETYGNYPAYLERSAELLGKEHYMYTTLQARKYFFEGVLQKDRDKKMTAYYKALNQQPDMPHAMVNLLRHFSVEQADSAEYYAQKAISIVPSWVEPYIALSHYYRFIAKQPEKTENMLKMAGEVDSTSVLVWYKKAQFYRDRRNFEEAEKWYLKITEGTGQDICFPCAYLDLGYVYQNQGRYDEALPYFQKALEIDSVSSEKYTSFCRPCTYINLSLNSVYRGDQIGRRKYLLKALEVDSTFAMAYYNLAIYYQDEKQDSLAEKTYEKCLHYNQNFSPAWVNIGTIYYKSSRLNEAEAAYKKALETTVAWAHPYAHEKLAVFYMDAERYEEAEHHFNKALELNPNHITALINKGRLFLRTNDIEGAKPLIEKAFDMQPDEPDVLVGLAQLAAKDNQLKLAWQYLEQGLEKGFDKYKELQNEPNFAEMKKNIEWKDLMKQYFPEQSKN